MKVASWLNLHCLCLHVLRLVWSLFVIHTQTRIPWYLGLHIFVCILQNQSITRLWNINVTRILLSNPQIMNNMKEKMQILKCKSFPLSILTRIYVSLCIHKLTLNWFQMDISFTETLICHTSYLCTTIFALIFVNHSEYGLLLSC